MSNAFYANYDISAHTDVVTSTTVANTLGDLTKCENRFYHGTLSGNTASGFPFSFPLQTVSASFPLQTVNLSSAILTGTRLGEDVILDNVLAFDIRVFDPMVPISYAPFPLAATSVSVGPSDSGYKPPTSINVNPNSGIAGVGGFVDLSYAISRSASFVSLDEPILGIKRRQHNWWIPPSATPPATYDTWSTHYEQNGYDEDGSGTADQGMNGLDDVSGPIATPTLAVNGIIDDPPSISVNSTSTLSFIVSAGERETLPPFPVPLRGLQVRIRVYEPDSRQVRQVTVTQDFMPH